MKTFIAANFALLPPVIFWALVTADEPTLAVGLAFVLVALSTGWRLRSGRVKSLEYAVLAFLSLLGLTWLAAWPWAMDHAVVASFIGLGLFSLCGAALGKPWTAEYSRGEFADVSDRPEFVFINQAITSIWGVIFLFFALAQAHSFGLWPTLIGGAWGALTSVVGPKLLMRLMLRRRLGRQEVHNWPAPIIGEARSDGLPAAPTSAAAPKPWSYREPWPPTR